MIEPFLDVRHARGVADAQYSSAPKAMPGWAAQDSAAGRGQFETAMEERGRGDQPGEWKAGRRGGCLRDERFRQELLVQMGGKPRNQLSFLSA